MEFNSPMSQSILGLYIAMAIVIVFKVALSPYFITISHNKTLASALLLPNISIGSFNSALYKKVVITPKPLFGL